MQMPNITLTISQVAYDRLDDHAQALGPNWSLEELAAELILDTFEDDGETRSYMARSFAWNPEGQGTGCSGECKGHGVGKSSHPGACPSPCDQATLDKLEKEAKQNARIAAIEDCFKRGDESCLCTGGTYTRGSYGCKTHKNDKDEDFCKYRVSYDYAGNCTTVA